MSSKATPVFAAFDLLWLNGNDLRDEPLLERKARLVKLVRASDERVLWRRHDSPYQPMLQFWREPDL
jgi:ATP-dependent DNA ligase